ncbi:hypothetical protein [Streptomyces sp. NPDC046925]|uniref:hypothetical protein n=1 Tax=Streptomyces sp. NPDC046925 TaxID=3155375 RepID=UPI0033CC695D
MTEQPPPAPRPHTSEAAHVLVIGATRILRPAVTALTTRAVPVLAVARSAPDLRELADEQPGRVTPLAADVTADGFCADLRAAAARTPLTGALVYAPAVPPGKLAQLVRPVVAGPLVLLVTSEWAAPSRSSTGIEPWTPNDLPAEARSGAAGRLLVLGWHGEGRTARWHSPQEISAAALALLDAPVGRDTVLGALRPWAARPT